MKTTLLACLAALALVGCSKKEDDAKPATPSLIGTWTLTSQTIVVTPKRSGTATTYPVTVVPNTITMTYATDGTYTRVQDKSVSPSGTVTISNGTYTYAGNTITYSAIGKTSTARVDVLTNNDLTHVATTEDAGGTQVNVTTNTYTR
jgi:hypothetical protein